jgi:hypothetical protein
LIVSETSRECSASPERGIARITANPKPVEIHLQTDRRYNPSDLAEYLDDQGSTGR